MGWSPIRVSELDVTMGPVGGLVPRLRYTLYRWLEDFLGAAVFSVSGVPVANIGGSRESDGY